MIASGQGHILEEEDKNQEIRDPNKTSMVKRDRTKKKNKQGEEDRARAESLKEDQEEVKEEVKQEQTPESVEEKKTPAVK
jgi:hypothetical protein